MGNRPSRNAGGMNIRRRITPTIISRRTPFMDNNLAKYHERLRITDKQMEEAVDKMPLSKYDQWFKIKEINPLLLIFRKLTTELDFIRQPDPLFKYYILSVFVILICMVAIQNFSQTEWNTVIGYISIVFVLLIVLPLTWIYGFWRCYRYNIKEEKKNPIINRVYKFSSAIMENITYRVIIYFVICLLCAGTVFSEMVQCEHFKGSNSTLKGIFIDVLFRSDVGEECMIPWHMTETCALIIIINYSFLRIHLWLKVLVSLVITALYSYFLWSFNEAYYYSSESLNHSVKGPTAHVVIIIYLLITLHFIDRQTDYMHRLDHQWRTQLNEEQEQAHILHEVNYKLLNNILPVHVSEYYTDNNRDRGLYYEEYVENDCVTVMFASIVNYDKELPDKILLSYLSGMITALDQLLLEKYNNVVEKIKIANWTYMAATGLDPGKRTSGTDGHRVRRENVMHLLNFAVDIKRTIKIIDREFQYPKLRIGIAHGPITAGVVGSKKPLYDIWGDAVNMASRMESTGVMDRIQVMEETATIIRSYGYSCTFRDYIHVKGRSANVPTYFVDVDEDDNLIKIC
ncbi:Adenylate and Guanylate cyclase [Oryctes borbonicus]|uniref:adenylate cyclase n=1 Tax=Oryctes borbonicus TaxID=1629725 RepID=A0A0T6B9P4_9SCAR|nr:Adenylate and Guanylate cyclase [Oryctes borbonicus]